MKKIYMMKSMKEKMRVIKVTTRNKHVIVELFPALVFRDKIMGFSYHLVVFDLVGLVQVGLDLVILVIDLVGLVVCVCVCVCVCHSLRVFSFFVMDFTIKFSLVA